MINKDKANDESIYLFRIKPFNKLGWEGKGTSFYLIKNIYKKTNNSMANITIMAKYLKLSPCHYCYYTSI